MITCWFGCSSNIGWYRVFVIFGVVYLVQAREFTEHHHWWVCGVKQHINTIYGDAYLNMSNMVRYVKAVSAGKIRFFILITIQTQTTLHEHLHSSKVCTGIIWMHVLRPIHIEIWKYVLKSPRMQNYVWLNYNSIIFYWYFYSHKKYNQSSDCPLRFP